MPDLLCSLMAAIPDDDSVATLASSFNARADNLSRQDGPEAAVWASVYSVLALSAESALLSKRTGISV